MPPTPLIPEPPLTALRFAIVVPMLNEAASVEPLVHEIAAACADLGPFEAVFVDDGSTDGTTTRIAALGPEFPWLRSLRHARPFGQSAAIRSGVLAATAPLIVTLDGDGQNPPAEIPRMLMALRDGGSGLGLVAGQRAVRHDGPTRRLASRLANRLRAFLLRDGAWDSACGLKVFPRAVYLALPHFDHMHRYLPALVRREGLAVAFVDVAHRPRRAGQSKYSILGRAIAGSIDLFGVWWLCRRRVQPGFQSHPGLSETAPASFD